MSLRDYTTNELAAEIRRREKTKGERVRLWCSECIYFKAWDQIPDPPNDYNPCSLGREMRFQSPSHDYTGDLTGFHRPGCRDRVQMTEEEMAKESARLQERWAWQFRHLPQAEKLPLK